MKKNIITITEELRDLILDRIHEQQISFLSLSKRTGYPPCYFSGYFSKKAKMGQICRTKKERIVRILYALNVSNPEQLLDEYIQQQEEQKKEYLSKMKLLLKINDMTELNLQRIWQDTNISDDYSTRTLFYRDMPINKYKDYFKQILKAVKIYRTYKNLQQELVGLWVLLNISKTELYQLFCEEKQQQINKNSFIKLFDQVILNSSEATNLNIEFARDILGILKKAYNNKNI